MSEVPGFGWYRQFWQWLRKPTMHEQLADRANKVMQVADQEAQRFKHEWIGTEHILLGLIADDSSVAALALKNLNVEPTKVRAKVEEIIRRGPDVVIRDKLPQTPRAKKVIEYSMEEARNLKHNYVGTEHILLGLLREQEGVGGVVLMNFGLTMENTRLEVIRVLAGKGARP